MEYIVLGQDEKEYGPVDQETLQKWVEHGRVFKDTKIRNALMKKWNDAGTMDFLMEAFSLQEVHEEEEEGVTGRVFDMLGLSSNKHELEEDEQSNTAFRLKYIPEPAKAFQRVAAFAFDSIIFAVFALILFFSMVIYTDTWVSVEDEGFNNIEEMTEESGESETAETTDTESTATAEAEDDNEEDIEEEEIAEPVVFPSPAKMKRTFYFIYALFFATVLLYYGVGLGIYAQTVGMWFWGIIIVKGNNDEVLPVRAAVFTLLMFFLGPLTPIVVLANPEHRSLHDYLTGTKLINVTARAKA